MGGASTRVDHQVGEDLFCYPIGRTDPYPGDLATGVVRQQTRDRAVVPEYHAG